jgi:hypothetical protein
MGSGGSIRNSREIASFFAELRYSGDIIHVLSIYVVSLTECASAYRRATWPEFKRRLCPALGEAHGLTIDARGGRMAEGRPRNKR